MMTTNPSSALKAFVLRAGLGLTVLPGAVAAQSSAHPASHAASHPSSPSSARATSLLPAAPDRPIAIELRSAVRAVAPGDTIPVAIRLRPNRGWRTYWRYAGDIGTAPSIHWSLPEGFTAAPLRWPAPVRYDAPPLASFAYFDEVHLLGAVHVPASARVGSVARLAVSLAWVVSNVECVPGEAEVALDVPVGPRTIRDEPVARAFAAAARRLPARREGWTFGAAVDSTTVLLRVNAPAAAAAALRHPSSRVQFFVDTAGVIDHVARPTVRRVPAGLEVQLGRSAFATRMPSRITGVLAIDTAAAGDRAVPRMLIEVDAPVVPRAQAPPR